MTTSIEKTQGRYHSGAVVDGNGNLVNLADLLAETGAVTRRRYSDFVLLFKGDEAGDNAYGIAAGAYTADVRITDGSWLAYPHFFYKSAMIGQVYLVREDDEGNVSATENSLGGTMFSGTNTDGVWRDTALNTTPPVYGSPFRLRIKNTSSVMGFYWLKMAGYGV